MGTEFGKDTRLNFGDGAGTEVFTTLGGEKSFDWTRASTDVDTTDKDGPAGVYVPGRVGFSVSGNVKLPNAALSRAILACKNGTPIDIKITSGVGGAVVRYQGVVTVGNMKVTYDTEGAVPYSFDMTQYSTPTVDALDAVPVA